MWMSSAWDKANRRRDDEEELQCLELQAWYDAVEEKDVLTEDTLAHERDIAEQDHADQKQELAAVRATLQDESRKMYELKREIAMVGYSEQLQPGASIEQRMESVMLFFRSRGVYGVSDFLSVTAGKALFEKVMKPGAGPASGSTCLLYTSDAADEEDSGDLGGHGISNKKKITENSVVGETTAR
eukprot:TRINITY_DN58363_c0_g1_i1.p1 TRINITY_DN58363_c0_g1~~TRINITY_DN58363_c0_g1_i1.p1  ORF type:complete len:185 (-),score=44.37 TRINITY_DN58363_c0_g1_i1:12-566(-)